MHPTVTASIRLDQLLGLRGEALASRIAEVLPDVGAAPCPPFSPPSLRGGRAAAVERLAGIEPLAYAQTRNHVAGAVTMLSPWIRHGVLSLAEVRDAALAKATRPEDALKLVSELGWRDYWRQVHDAIGDAILTDIEPPAATPRRQPVDRMPDDVLEARTGMACIDAFVRRLHDTGWLHNHERMWLASWLVHVRGVHWRAGADWFLRHLLDGDPASNHLSWQWIAGTFSAKPYLFNRAYTKMNFKPLLEMDMNKIKADKKVATLPAMKRYTAWIKRQGKGHVFYCSPSHFPASFDQPALLQFMLGGIQYALGDLDCDDTPVGK
jgi:deoxyribodipyrimidine photo-lyase